MSILSKSNSSSSNMGTPFHEFRKQASFFLKEKIKSARLALTDVTPAQLLTEEATNGNPWAPDTRTLKSISKSAFELDDYWRIVEILHNRFTRFERKNWRVSYNSLIVLEHLLTHGPESVAAEFQSDKDVIKQIQSFQYIDEKGFNWGLAVRKKSERILKLLEKDQFLKEERDRARKLTRGIQGFGSFIQRNNSSANGVLQESSKEQFARSNSQFTDHVSFENQSNEDNIMHKDDELKGGIKAANPELSKRKPNSTSDVDFGANWRSEKPEISCKENTTPKEDKEELHRWNRTGEDNPLLDEREDEGRIAEESHPFSATEDTKSSLLRSRSEILQGY